MFDPSIGRWITPDPIGFGAGDTNLYRAMGNNLTNRTDPSGLDWRDWVYPVFPGAALTAELIGGGAPTPQATAVGSTYTWLFAGPHSITAAQMFWLWVANTQMQQNGMPLAAALLGHSLTPAPSLYTIGPGHFAYGTIQGNADLQARLRQIAMAAPIGTSTGTESVEFTNAQNADLFAAIHYATIKYKITKRSNDDYTIEYVVQDKYKRLSEK